MVETTLDLASLDTHTYTLKPEYDEGLQALAEKLMEVTSLSEISQGTTLVGLMHII